MIGAKFKTYCQCSGSNSILGIGFKDQCLMVKHSKISEDLVNHSTPGHRTILLSCVKMQQDIDHLPAIAIQRIMFKLMSNWEQQRRRKSYTWQCLLYSLTQMLWLGCNLNFVEYSLFETKQPLQSLLPVEAPLQWMEPTSKTLDIRPLLIGEQHLWMKSWSNVYVFRFPSAQWTILKSKFWPQYSPSSFQCWQLSTYG